MQHPSFLPVAFIKKRPVIKSTGEQLKPPEPAHKSLTPFQYPKFERIAQSHNASIRPIDVPAGFSHPKEYHLGFHTSEHGNQTVTLFLLPQHVSKGVGHVDYSDFEKAHDSLAINLKKIKTNTSASFAFVRSGQRDGAPSVPYLAISKTFSERTPRNEVIAELFKIHAQAAEPFMEKFALWKKYDRPVVSGARSAGDGGKVPLSKFNENTPLCMLQGFSVFGLGKDGFSSVHGKSQPHPVKVVDVGVQMAIEDLREKNLPEWKKMLEEAKVYELASKELNENISSLAGFDHQRAKEQVDEYIKSAWISARSASSGLERAQKQTEYDESMPRAPERHRDIRSLMDSDVDWSSLADKNVDWNGDGYEFYGRDNRVNPEEEKIKKRREQQREKGLQEIRALMERIYTAKPVQDFENSAASIFYD
ncbi:MAG: hypothetical protein WCX64_05055 [Candidatus Micrarchaeia archaeon]